MSQINEVTIHISSQVLCFHLAGEEMTAIFYISPKNDM